MTYHPILLSYLFKKYFLFVSLSDALLFEGGGSFVSILPWLINKKRVKK